MALRLGCFGSITVAERFNDALPSFANHKHLPSIQVHPDHIRGLYIVGPNAPPVRALVEAVGVPVGAAIGVSIAMRRTVLRRCPVSWRQAQRTPEIVLWALKYVLQNRSTPMS